MRLDYLQNLRVKFQRRFLRVKSSGWQQYTGALMQFWAYFDAEPTLVAIVQEMEARFPDGSKIAEEIKAAVRQNGMVHPQREGDLVAASYQMLREFSGKIHDL